MKIAFLGNFNVDYSSESHYLKTFQKLGHEVITIQEGSSELIQIINSSYKFYKDWDMFFWVHTHGWQTLCLDQVLNHLKIAHIPIVGYHLDLWMGIDRQKDLQNDDYWKWLDYFFTADRNFVPVLEKMGLKAYYLPAGVFEDECYIAEPDRVKYPHDIIFVGSRNYHPEWPYRKQLIEFLEKTYGNKFAQYGNGGLGTIRGHELNVLYASAKVVIGDTLCKNFDYPDYFSDRLFETTGRGGLLIMPYIRGLEDMFNMKGYCHEEQVEIITYKFEYLQQLLMKIDNVLVADPIDTYQLRLAGHKRTKRDHTYTQRLSYLLRNC